MPKTLIPGNYFRIQMLEVLKQESLHRISLETEKKEDNKGHEISIEPFVDPPSILPRQALEISNSRIGNSVLTHQK